MSTPGINDPTWYEWFVGIKHIVEMLNPDSNIKCVIFQHGEFDTIDDVVVELKDGSKQICYQIKHEISTSQGRNLTFGKLMEEKDGKTSLIAAIFVGWRKANEISKCKIEPILYTNRSLGLQRTKRNFNGKNYEPYLINEFISKIKEVIKSSNDKENIIISDYNLLCQWEEVCEIINDKDKSAIVDFFLDLKIKYNQPKLKELEEEIIKAIAEKFLCSEDLAVELFSKIIFALKDWTTTRRKDEKITVEDVYSALGIEADPNDSQHRLVYPEPFFGSRKEFCNSLHEKLTTTDKKVVFISGDPGSGKTSVISYLQFTSNIFTLRFHTFRPISPQQHFYNLDEGICSVENLWGTLLIQLRRMLKGKLAQYNVPVSNKLLNAEMMRKHVLRLLGILAAEGRKGEKVFVCIDGIDHAARAKSKISFLSSLPLPTEIPEGVCFVIVGQPIAVYRKQYPAWLSEDEFGKNLEYIEIPKLCVEDIKQIISDSIPQLDKDYDGLASYILNCTQGNNLSLVFAIEEIKSVTSLDEAINKLSTSGITEDIQQYYSHIWSYVEQVIAKMRIGLPFPEIVVACPILLMNGRINTRILANALPYKISQSDWELIFAKLFPLVVSCGSNEYALFHNDFRVFLMGIIKEYKSRYEEIALYLAEYLLNNDEGLISYVSSIPLLQCANRYDLIPKYLTSEFIINALAEGISKSRLDEYANIAYSVSCKNQNIDYYLNTYLAIKTLHQHERYFEHYQRNYISEDLPEISNIDIAEIRSLSISNENLNEFEKVLDLCLKLNRVNTVECQTRAILLYNRWFGNLSPYSFISLCFGDISEDKYWDLKHHDVGLLLQQWGRTSAELKMLPPKIEDLNTDLESYAKLLFGEAYFEQCIESNYFDQAIKAIDNSYVSQDIFVSKLEDIYYKGLTEKFKQILPRASLTPDKTSLKLFSMAIHTTVEQEFNVDEDIIKTIEPIKHIYDETSFSLVLISFLCGFKECSLDDAVICGHIKQYQSSIESKDEQAKIQISQLTRFACLLGKYYYSTNPSKNLIRSVEWFLTTKLYRSFDYIKARKFLLFTLLKSSFGSILVKNDSFIESLKVSLCDIDLIGMYYKTHILDFLVLHKRLDVIQSYIYALYGKDSGKIIVEENRYETHKVFCPYGNLVDPNLMEDITDKFKWDVVGYVGYKEYAMQGPSDIFEALSLMSPEVFSTYGERLYKQSKIAELSNNGYADEICKSLITSAIKCGVSEFNKLRMWDKEFRYDIDLIYHSLFAFIEEAKCGSDLIAIWLLNCGIHSWYTEEERNGSKHIFTNCDKKALSLGIDFKDIVAEITPQWLTIIEHELSKKDIVISSTDDYSKTFEKRKNDILNEYNTYNVEELMSALIHVPTQDYSTERYLYILNRLIDEKQLLRINAEKILYSVIVYINDSMWRINELEEVLITLFNVLGDKAFWAIAQTIKDNLSDYSYQSSTRAIQFLLKLHFSSDATKLRILFERELDTQEKWVSGNKHIEVKYELPTDTTAFVSTTISEIAYFSLIEQLKTQNGRKVETALYAIYNLGKYLDVITLISKSWPNLSELQKDLLLISIARWQFEGTELDKLNSILYNEYISCNKLLRKYYLHSILKDKYDLDIGKISCDAEAIKYSLPIIGNYSNNSSFESFLCLDKTSNDIRRFIEQFSAEDTFINDEFDRNYYRIPAYNQVVDQILYGEEKNGRWDSIPMLRKKERLIAVEDPFILTEMPKMVYDDKWFPQLPDNLKDSDYKNTVNEELLSNIANYNVGEDEIVLAANVWFPWDREKGIIFNKVAKIDSKYNYFRSNRLNRSVGNFGLLFKEGSLDEYYEEYLDYGGVNLFNLVGGKTRFYYGSSQLIPSSVWADIFNCTIDSFYPYAFLDENSNQILRFEFIASPIRSLSNEHYFRQPVLFRWICKKGWLNDILKKQGLQIWFVKEVEDIPL